MQDVVKSAEVGADLPLLVKSGLADDAIADAKLNAKAGAEFPLLPETAAAEIALGTTRGIAAAGADFPILPDTGLTEEAIGQLIAVTESGATMPVGLNTEQALTDLRRLQDAVSGSVITPNVNVDGANAAIRSLGGVANQSEGALGSLGASIGGLTTGVGSLGAGITGTAGRLTGLLSSSSLLVGGGLIGGAFAGASILSAGQNRLTTIEDSVAALEVQLGSAKAAGDVVADVLRVVKGTPFTLDQFIEAARTLTTFGVAAEKIPDYLTAIGEAAAGSGRGIEAVSTITDVFAKMQIAGRVTTDDWQRLSYVGVNALKLLGNAFGVTAEEMQGMITDGAVPANRAIDALIKGINEGSNGAAGQVNKLGGSMEKLRNTFSGAAGGLQAASARLGVAFLEPLRPASVKLLQTATEALDGLAPAAKKVFTALADTGIVDRFADALGSIPKLINETVAAFEEGGVGAALGKLFGNEEVGKTLGEILGRVGSVALSLKNILSEVVAAAAPIATVFGGALLNGLNGVLAILDPLLSTLAEAGPVVQALAVAVGGLVILKQFDPIESLLQRIIEGGKAGVIAAEADAAAQLKDAAATDVNSVAKGRLAVQSERTAAGIVASTRAQVAATLQAQRATVAANAGIGFSSNAAAINNATAEMAKVNGLANRTAVTAQAIGTNLTAGLGKATTAMTNFFQTFKTEIFLASAFFTAQLVKGAIEAQEKTNQARGRNQIDALLPPEFEALQKGAKETANSFEKALGPEGQKNLIDYTAGMASLEFEQQKVLDKANEGQGVGGFSAVSVERRTSLWAPSGTSPMGSSWGLTHGLSRCRQRRA